MPFVLLLLCLLAGGAKAHDIYSELRNSRNESCCDDDDCRPVAQCALPDGGAGVAIERRCVRVDPAVALPSPDGRAHACYYCLPGTAGGCEPIPRCILLPGAA